MALAPQHAAIGIRRHFTAEGVHPYDLVEWERRDARIIDWRTGAVAFEQLGVEVPSSWSVNATNILAQKYFRGHPGSPTREWSLKQVVDRIADTITAWGDRDGYFADTAEMHAFRDELKHLMVTQRVAFNSPVWFNIGVPGARAQSSACFILSVDDTMESILNWYAEEGRIFKGGSGAGINLSTIRSSREHLAGGGTASGPVSFMRGADASAGTIKSGGTTRRAAKMVILDADHPDIEEFIWCKAIEERKARVLRDAGFDMDLDGADGFSIQYQNANNSVRLTDEFMQAVLDDGDWQTRARLDGSVVTTVKARDIMRQISEAAWECADPGLQFDTTINRWHTAANTGRITASNPCSEYLSLDNSACNLASLNVMRFLGDEDTGSAFDVEAFKAAVEVTFTAQEILVGNSEYPTEQIGETTRAFRQIGLGYTNLGASLMALGLPYDSDEGRAFAGTITALMTGQAYLTSARIASRMGPFAGFHANREPTLRVLDMHRDAAADIDEELVDTELLGAAQCAWDDAVELARQVGVRNSQATVLAPTGTISFVLDCDTTGVEPDLGLVKTKKLVGGGSMSIVNQTVPRALRRLGYSGEAIEQIVAHIAEHNSILGSPGLDPEHLLVFACSMGDNVIHYRGHLGMLAAVQPFISGSVSKCVTGDTLVPTADGLIRIGSFYRNELPDRFRDKIVEVATADGIAKSDAFYYGGVRPVRTVTLRSGQRITGTPNHRVLVAADGGPQWRRLDEITLDDHVATQIGSQMWSTTPASLRSFVPGALYGSQKQITIPTEMTEELAFLLGAFASEGHISRSNHSVFVTNSVEYVRDRVVDAFATCFGIKAVVVDDGQRCPMVRASSKSLIEFLDHLGCGGRASEKRIPDAVLRSPESMVLSFLQGLWLDAYVHIPAGKWAICLDASAMLDDLQAVLANLGVRTGRTRKFNRKYQKHYDEVYATGRDAALLVELVPFLEPDKRVRARAMLLKAVAMHDTADVVPGLSPRALHSMIPRSKSGRNGQRIRTPFSFLCDPRTKHVSRRTVERVATIDGVQLPDWLRSVLDGGLHFSPVASVDDSGEAEVFDLSVPGPRSFIGNGIVSHNTVNVPEETTVEEIEALHLEAWQSGIKCVAIYRDNCKVGQPLSVTKKAGATSERLVPDAVHHAATHSPQQVVERIVERVSHEPVRRKMPRSRVSRTFEFRVADCKGFVTVGEYEDGRPGEIFVRVSKQGSTLAGIMDAFAISISHGLQYGVPLRAFVEAFVGMRFEPAGMTDDPDIRIASSLLDYLFRRLAVEYMGPAERAELNILTTGERTQPTLPGVEEAVTETSAGSDIEPDPPSLWSPAPEVDLRHDEHPPAVDRAAADAPLCMTCGIHMQRAGSCYVCHDCGMTSGCS